MPKLRKARIGLRPQGQEKRILLEGMREDILEEGRRVEEEETGESKGGIY